MRAQAYFARGWCGLGLLQWVGILVAQRFGHMQISGLSAQAFALIAALHTLLALLQALLPLALPVRLLVQLLPLVRRRLALELLRLPADPV